MLLTQPTSWNPWNELQSLTRQLDELFSPTEQQRRREFPAVNIWSEEDQSVLTAELPGINPAELEITCRDNTVTLKGVRHGYSQSAEDKFLRRERRSGSFQRSFTLPFKVDEEKISAEYKHGIVSVILPRREKPEIRNIEIKIN